MRTTDSYARLRAYGQPVIETHEAAARLGASSNAATKVLRSVEQAGLARRLRRGLWALDVDVDPLVVAPYLTAPYPAYVSLWSALSRHDMIEQIPAAVHVVTLDRSRDIDTPVGRFKLHHVAAPLFNGFDGDARRGYVARPEKALFDTVYVTTPRGGGVHFPELTIPDGFDRALLDGWISAIPPGRMRTIVSKGIAAALDTAERLVADDYKS